MQKKRDRKDLSDVEIVGEFPDVENTGMTKIIIYDVFLTKDIIYHYYFNMVIGQCITGYLKQGRGFRAINVLQDMCIPKEYHKTLTEKIEKYLRL